MDHQTLLYAVLTAMKQPKGGLWAELLDNETNHTVQVFKGGSISFNGKMIDDIEEIYRILALELENINRFHLIG